MKTLNRIVCFAVLALAMAATSFAQVTLRSTTLAAAVSKTDNTISLTSATGVTAGMVVYVSGDREAMRIRSITGTTADVTNYRGISGTSIVGHASGATVYVDLPQYFTSGITGDKSGTCTSTSELVLPVVNVTTGNIYQCTSSVWTVINGPASTGTGLTSLGPNAAGTVDVGSATLPFRYLYVAGTSGTPATNNFKLSGASTSGTRTILLPDSSATALVSSLSSNNIAAANSVWGVSNGLVFEGTTADSNNTKITPTDPTGARVITLPDASITVPGTVYSDCATANACSPTVKSSVMKVITGISAALDGASPALAHITAISPSFTAAGDYHCALTLDGTGATAVELVEHNVSGTAFDITATNWATALVHYVCIGF